MWISVVLWPGAVFREVPSRSGDFWLVTLVWREWWLQSVWSVAAGDLRHFYSLSQVLRGGTPRDTHLVSIFLKEVEML